MRDAVIVDAVRTPVGKRRGGLSGIHPADLSATVLRSLAERNNLDPVVVDDVLWGCVTQVGEQTLSIGRTSVLSAGWPETVPSMTIDRQCGSAQQAIHSAAAGLIAGQYDVAVAGGVESMSRVPMNSGVIDTLGHPYDGLGFSGRYDVRPDQGVGAEMVASRWKLSRTELDEFSLASHARAAAAQDAGLFDGQIAAVTTADGVMSADEGIRRGGSMESMSKLKPAFLADGVIHAGNASQISDGSAAVLMTTSENAERLGLRPWARVHTAVVIGDDPVIMLTAPIPATARALARSGLSLDDIGVFEVNEAFASVPLAWLAEFDVDPAKLNPLGGAIALGHPLGCSGARIATTMLHHMRENRIRYGLQTMCEGGGQANATIFELLD